VFIRVCSLQVGKFDDTSVMFTGDSHVRSLVNKTGNPMF